MEIKCYFKTNQIWLELTNPVLQAYVRVHLTNVLIVNGWKVKNGPFMAIVEVLCLSALPLTQIKIGTGIFYHQYLIHSHFLSSAFKHCCCWSYITVLLMGAILSFLDHTWTLHSHRNAETLIHLFAIYSLAQPILRQTDGICNVTCQRILIYIVPGQGCWFMCRMLLMKELFYVQLSSFRTYHTYENWY